MCSCRALKEQDPFLQRAWLSFCVVCPAAGPGPSRTSEVKSSSSPTLPTQLGTHNTHNTWQSPETVCAGRAAMRVKAVHNPEGARPKDKAQQSPKAGSPWCRSSWDQTSPHPPPRAVSPAQLSSSDYSFGSSASAGWGS